jgi:hypothetical protein
MRNPIPRTFVSLSFFSRFFQVFLCALGTLGLAGQSFAATLYGSTSAGGPGELYILNPATGAALLDVGPLNDSLAVNYPVTGLAFNPINGFLYGSTGNSVAATEAKLIRINPVTAQVTVIGSFNAGPVNTGGTPATMADLAFDSAGNLYGIGSIGGPQLYSINTGTGQATVIGGTGLTSTTGGGLAISAGSIFYGTPTSARFGTYDSTTGAFTLIANPTKPVGGAYAALGFDESGTLYGLDLGPGTGGLVTHLVTFNPSNGAVTDLGVSVTALDAIAFAAVVPEPGTMSLLLCGIAGLLIKARRRK